MKCSAHLEEIPRQVAGRGPTSQYGKAYEQKIDHPNQMFMNDTAELDL